MRTILSLLLSACGLFAQNYTGAPVITFTASAQTVTSGSAVILTFTNTCPAGTCTVQLYARAGGSSITSSIVTGPTSPVTVNPTKTTQYSLMVQCPSCAASSTGIIDMRTLWVAVGTGALAVTQLTSAQNNGPGVPATIPVGQMVELTYNDTVAGCGGYVSHGTVTVPCSGGNVSNPQMDAWGQCTWTGANTSTVITTQSFYEGGANSGNGNFWKIRFTPPVADIWSTSCIFTDPADYKTFTNTNLFTSVADPNYHGALKISGVAGNLLATADGTPFYPIGTNVHCGDAGNIGCYGTSWIQTYGNNPSPLTGGALSLNATFGTAVATNADAGINTFAISDDAIQNWNTQVTTAGALNLTLINYGVGLTNGTITHTGGVVMDAGLMTIQAMRQHTMVTCETAPDGTYYNGVTNMNPFTTPAITFFWFLGIQDCINRYGSLTDIYVWSNEQPLTTNAAWVPSTALWMKQQDPYGHLVTVTMGSGNGTSNNPAQFSTGPNIDVVNTHTTFGTASGASLVVTATANAYTACSCSNPMIFGEFTQSVAEVPGVNLAARSIYWAGLFKQSYPMPYPSGTAGGPSNAPYLGNPQFVQIANISSYEQSFDPATTALVITLSGQGCGGCTVQSAALGSTADEGAYIWNTTSTTAVTGMTATWTVPTASMNCSWISPLDGHVISTFTTSGTPGSQGFAVPTITSSGVYQPDIVLRCRTPTVPAVTTVTIPAGGLGAGASYSQTLTAAGGAGAPFTFAITKGALPPGLSLNTSTGVISGTSTTAGFWHFTVTARDTGGTTSAPQDLIIPIMALPAIGSTTLDNTPIGYAPGTFFVFASQVPITGGCQPITASMTSSSLVSGISIVNSTMSLSGSATAAGTMTLTPSITDACGNTVTSPNITVIAPVRGTSNVTMQTAAFGGITQGFSYSTQLQARVQTGATTGAVTSGTLPTGLACVNSCNGPVFQFAGTNISGTTQTISFTPSDTTGAGAIQPYTLTVNAAPSIATSSLSGYSSTAPYLATIATANGTQPNACTLSPGSGPLPSGFFLSTVSSTLYGPPLAGGATYPISVSCYDVNHAGAAMAFNLQPASSPASGGLSGTATIGGTAAIQ